MRTNPVLDQVGAHPIASIQQTVRDLRAAGRPVIDFSIGDPKEPTWDAIPVAVRQAVPVVSQYPTTKGLPELREAIAGYAARRFGIEVDPETQVIPTSGSKEAIFSSALAFVDRDRGDVIGYPDPGYPVYRRGAELAGAESVAIAADESFVVSAGNVPDDLWSRLAMLWICTPSNPTGAVTPKGALEELVERSRSHDVLLCSDECYLDLYPERDDPPPSVLEVAGPGSEGVLTFLSLSKRSGMTGYRSGAIVGDPEAIERIFRLRTSTGTASPEFVQAGAIAAWSDDDHVAERRRVFDQKRDILRPVLADAGLNVVASEAGLYLWVSVGSGREAEVCESLAAAGVVVSPGSIFGSRGADHIRMALVPALEDCAAAAEVLRSVL